MRIIKRGVDPKVEPIQATCRNCGTVFEFHPMEAQYVTDQRDGDFYQLDCPVCKREMTKAARP